MEARSRHLGGHASRGGSARRGPTDERRGWVGLTVQAAQQPTSVGAGTETPRSTLAQLPIVVGVTGHRDPREADRPALEALVDRVFSEIRSQHPHTPLVLLSPLAEGADRLVARVALAHDAILIVPLPLPQELYEKDFTTPESLAEFRELLERGEYFILPLASGNARRDIEEPGVGRDLQYALAGAYVARHCQFLVALWDGTPSTEIGGTGQVVKYKLTGRLGISADLAIRLEDIPEPYSLSASWLDAPETGIVYQVVTRRGRDHDAGEPPALRTLLPAGNEGPERAELYIRRAREIGRRIDEFNGDASRCTSQDAQTIVGSRASLLPDGQAGALHPAVQEMRAVYALADTLARAYQKRTRRSLILLSCLGFVAAISFTVYARSTGRPQENPLFLAVYLSTLALGLAAYLHAKQHELQPKHLEYRALAEGLRVQFFWRLAGLGQSAADHYLRKQKSTIDWIRHGIRYWSVRARPELMAADSLQLVGRHWVQHQAQYYRRAGALNHRAAMFFRSVGQGSFLLSILLGWALTVHRPAAVFGVPVLLTTAALVWWGIQDREARVRALHVSHVSWPWLGWTVIGGLVLLAFMFVAWRVLLPSINTPTWVLSMMGLTGLISGGLHLYADKMAFAQLSKQYERMQLVFALAQQRFTELSETTPSAAQHRRIRELLLELGKDVLAENGDWVLLQRERPLEVLKG